MGRTRVSEEGLRRKDVSWASICIRNKFSFAEEIDTFINLQSPFCNTRG